MPLGTDGLNVAVIVHFAPTARVEGLIGQLWLDAKLPLETIELIASAPVPLLVRTAVFEALVVPSN